jgi:hypothetical protein
MTFKERTMLIEQAEKLYTLGLNVEKYRDRLRSLAEKKIPYNSIQMKKALIDFSIAENEWKKREKMYLDYRKKIGAEEKYM